MILYQSHWLQKHINIKTVSIWIWYYHKGTNWWSNKWHSFYGHDHLIRYRNQETNKGGKDLKSLYELWFWLFLKINRRSRSINKLVVFKHEMRKRVDRMHNIIYCQRFSAILESHFHFHNSLNFDRFFLCEFCPKHLLKHFIESKTIFGKSRTSTCIYIYIFPCFNREQNSSSQTRGMIDYFYTYDKINIPLHF